MPQEIKRIINQQSPNNFKMFNLSPNNRWVKDETETVKTPLQQKRISNKIP